MELLPLQPYQEKPGQCGPASLKMVLAYYGVEKSEDELARLTNCDSTLGTSAENLMEVAHSFGFQAELKDQSSFEDIESWLQKKVPVIVDWFSPATSPDLSEVGDGHYSPVVGLDETFIYLQDPEIAAVRKITRHDFMRVWFDFEGNAMKEPEDLILRRLITIYK